MPFGAAFNFPGNPSVDGQAPDGYRVTTRSREIGVGRERFESAADAVLSWAVHSGSGFRAVEVPDRVAVGATSVWEVPFGPLHPRVACRVFAVVNEPRRVGFGHGALDGHPQSGWESYVVSLDEDDVVRLRIRVVWKPAAWWMRAAGPFGRLALDRLLARNLRALDPVGSSHGIR